MASLDILLTAQDDLIAALQQRDVARIEATTERMAEAVEQLKAEGLSADTVDVELLGASRTRNIEAAKHVNSLTEWTRKRREMLDGLRGGDSMIGRPAY